MQAVYLRATMSAGSMFEFDSWSFTHQFKINLEEKKKPLIGEAISSEEIYAGGHFWRINWYPRGDTKGDKGDYASVYLCRESGAKDDVQSYLREPSRRPAGVGGRFRRVLRRRRRGVPCPPGRARRCSRRSS